MYKKRNLHYLSQFLGMHRYQVSVVSEPKSEYRYSSKLKTLPNFTHFIAGSRSDSVSAVSDQCSVLADTDTVVSQSEGEERVEKWRGAPGPGAPCQWEIQDKKGAF